MEHHGSEQPPTYQRAVQDTPDRANLMAMSPSQLARLEAVEDFGHRRELRSIEKKLRALELRNAESRRASIVAAETERSMTSNYSAQMDEATTKLNKYLDIIIKFLAVEHAADSVPQVTAKNKQMFEFRSNVWRTVESSFSSSKDASRDMHVQRLRWLSCRILLVDYGITKPESRDVEARAAISDMTKALQKYQLGQSLDDAYRTDPYLHHHIRQPAQELNLPLKLVEAYLLLHCHHPRSIETFWAPKGLEALAFKLCCDLYLSYTVCNTGFLVKYDLDISGGIMSVCHRYFPADHYWMRGIAGWEEEYPEIRRKREKLDKRRKKVERAHEREGGCVCM